jgi:hypothetical protein
VLGLRGVRVEQVRRLPPAPKRRALTPGRRIAFADVRSAVGFTPLLPRQPVPTFIARDVPKGRLSLLIGPLLLTEFRGQAFPFIFKTVGPGTKVKLVHIGRDRGLYLAGAPHELLLQSSGGTASIQRLQVAGNVLLWQHGKLTLRLEGVHSLAQARSVARGLGPAPAAACPISSAAGPRPPKFALQNFGQAMAKPSDPGWLGNGVLWTRAPGAVQVFLDRKAHLLTTKVGFFRARPGPLTLSGSVLNGRAARFAGDIPPWTDYGRTGFIPAGLGFGRAGCWVVHARLGPSDLRIVLSVQAPHTP